VSAAAFDRLNDPAPRTRLLSNGRYSVLITGAGSGYSAHDGWLLTGWSADRVEDGEGFFLYLRDLDGAAVWSVCHQPIPGGECSTSPSLGAVGFARLDHGIATRLRVCVAPTEDVELRRLWLENRSSRARRIEVTSYAEVVLNAAAAHAAHPAFSKLFVQTEFAPHEHALLARRRPRSDTERSKWMLHALQGIAPLEWETDRARFLGRGRSLARPLALSLRESLSATTGNVLDPVFSLRCAVRLAPGQAASLTFVLGAADTHEAALALAARFSGADLFDQVCEQARQSELALLRRLGIGEDRAEYLQDLAGAIVYGHPALRRETRNHSSPSEPFPSALSKYRLSQDLPLVVAADSIDAATALDLVRAHSYWQAKGFPVNLVVSIEPGAAAQLAGAILEEAKFSKHGTTGRALIVPNDSIPKRDLDCILASASAVLAGELPDLSGPDDRPAVSAGWPRRSPTRGTNRVGESPIAGEPLLFDNGYGGFAGDGSEYVIRVATGDGGPLLPPMPWINVVANESFGFLVSETGAGYTWSRNSRENRLTPWYNDPIADPHGEALYLRDDESGIYWSPLPGPVPSGAPYEARHGFGYSSWRHSSHDLDQETCCFVPRGDSVKVTRLRLKNMGARERRVSLFSYYRLVMGGLASQTARTVSLTVDPKSKDIFARNFWNGEFADALLFSAAVGPDTGVKVHATTDRASFIGRNRTPAAPAALQRRWLDDQAERSSDPCAALQLSFSIQPGEELECAVLLGEAGDEATARRLIERYRDPAAVQTAHDTVREFWREALSAVRVETPAPEIDLMMNGWLGYQNLSCRLWGRSAFYQSGGAFGFRDQLQDVAALVYSRPDLTRSQILLHAQHQFVEGDVLHWWHPPNGRGVRTRFSDDLLWLPHVTAFYLRTTGDWNVLDEMVGFVDARPLEQDEDEAYLLPVRARETADLYTHCCRAIDRSLTCGVHGLPLMGTGDWNDGMNRVGRQGRGESVWLGFFLYDLLASFVPICERRGDEPRSRRYREFRAQLQKTLNDDGWDGHWYRRAFDDDGAVLGSATNDECQIDALVQAWSVISGAAPAERAARAMDAVERRLVREDPGMIHLLIPPFDRTPRDPGYIKGYVPGIRENGGQYTHAALWVVRAMAESGRRDRAAALLRMLSPVYHSRSRAEVERYQVEPYVVVADVYGTDPHIGRGGWSWYTGSAGWMYRVALESILGVTIEDGTTLCVKPRIPDHWPGFRVSYRLPGSGTKYEIEVLNRSHDAAAVISATIDGREASLRDGAARIQLVRDGNDHPVRIRLGRSPVSSGGLDSGTTRASGATRPARRASSGTS
jgi:cellobiose phosphorylase